MILQELSRGIPHIEDLPPLEFISTIRDLNKYEATEKLDGSQILFGIDETGFYTSRESKGGHRFYKESDYGLSFNTTFQRAAHKVLESVLFNLKAGGLTLGDQIEAEVLFGGIPNVVPYSSTTNYIVLLRATSGGSNIDKLVNHPHGLTNITLEVPYTDDGITTQIKQQTSMWAFDRSPVIKLPQLSENIYTLVRDFKSYLMVDSGVNHLTNGQLESLPMNRIPEGMDSNTWRNMKSEIKQHRQLVRNNCDIIKLTIKNDLLDLLVRNRSSQFGPATSSGGWIEGIVLTHADSGRMIKLVDKDIFGVARIFAWEVRNRLNFGKFVISIRNDPGSCELKYTQLKEDLDKYVREEKYTGTLDNRTKEIYASMFAVISEVRSGKLFHSNE